MKRIESKYRDQFIQYLITQVPVTGLWASEGQVLVRENGSLKIFPLESLGSKFTSEDDAEIYIVGAASQMIDKLLETK
jgi:hypothetical protein